jgi:hypothetical protein
MRQGFQPLADCRAVGLSGCRAANRQLPTVNCELTTASAGRADSAVKVAVHRD